MTEIIRTEAPTESISALLIIYILAFYQVFFAGLLIAGLILEWPAAWLSLWIAFMFVGLGALVELYRRNFLPDEMLVKVRLPKVVPRRKLRE